MGFKGSKNGRGDCDFVGTKCTLIREHQGESVFYLVQQMTFGRASFVSFCTLLSVGKRLFICPKDSFHSVFGWVFEAGVGRIGGRGDPSHGHGGQSDPRGNIGVETNRLRAACPHFLVTTPISQKNTWAIDHKRHGLKQVTQCQTYRPRCKRFTIAEPQRSFWITIFVEKGSQ